MRSSPTRRAITWKYHTTEPRKAERSVCARV
jgi:hypothetical protein